MISKPLGAIAIVIAGQSPPSSTYNSVGDGLPFFQGKADFQEIHPKVRIWSTSTQRKEAEPGDILISVRAPVGAVNICNQKSIIGRGLSAIRPTSSLDGKFLYYYLKANEKQIEALGTGSTFKAITQDTLKKVSVPLLTPEDQKRIAYLLGKVEGAIAQRKQHLQQLDDLLKSVFLEMFEFRDYSFKKFDIDKLSSQTVVVSGVTKGKKYKEEDLIEVPYMRVANVQDGYFNLNEIKTISATSEEIEKYQLKKGDLLLTEGGDPDKLGRGSVWENQIDDCIHQNHIFRVRINNQSRLNPYYLSALVSSQYGKSYFLKSAKQTTGIASINSTQLKNFPAVIPPPELQNQFAAIVEKVEGIKSSYQASLTDLETLYGALSQKAFKGELDLSRVPLAPEGREAEAAKTYETTEPQPTTDAFELPSPSDLAILNSTEGRHTLLDQWLTVCLERLNDVPFSTQSFMEAAQKRLWELAEELEKNAEEPEEDAEELGAAEYDRIKAWMFESLKSGRLAQTYDDAKNCVQLEAVSY
jgi:type I restriction enzyme, S subunit